ncbi:MAG: WD40-like beta Propeller containing protein [Edaphobacter sp.]|nr:WD40-like beta Propeller containing protein [Edaphobacter sp.]
MSTVAWTMVVEWMLSTLMIAYFGGHTLPAAWKTLNTDFSNYYLTARLAREKNETARIYEWIWLQRQKDHRDIDQRIISLVPITPFSTLAVWPLASLPPLAAKHRWLMLNIGMVAAIAVLLRSLTGLPLRRIILVIALSVPLNKNFLYGQYYVFLLLVLTLACWCYARQERFLSGLLVGLGFGLKIFPIIFLGYFLRKRDFKAFTGGVVGATGAVIASIAVFGWQANRVLFNQVLPWTLRGEGLDPYNLSSASVATLLHRLFIYEPQWNPSPFIHAPWLFAVLLPLAQTLLFAPALLLTEPVDSSPERMHLEWSAVMLGSLAISTLPAGYHFTLLILPVCLMWNAVEERGGLAAIVAFLLLSTAIGYPGWKTIGAISPWALFSVPRLYLVVLLCFVAYWILARQKRDGKQRRETWFWAGAFVLLISLSIALGLRHQGELYADYQWRLPTAADMLQANGPVAQSDTILFTAMVPSRYRTATQKDEAISFDASKVDQLAVAATSVERWTEVAGRESAIVSSVPGREKIPGAESPVVSPNGKWLAYLREEQGRASIWLHALDRPESRDTGLTPPEFDALEMSFLPNGSLIFSAESNGGRPGLFLLDQTGTVRSLGSEEARYPAISPDGHWLAFSKLQSGNWHLWLRDLHNGQTSRLTHADCNNVEPTWEPDSKTLVYASDCGRALWFTALCRRHIP